MNGKFKLRVQRDEKRKKEEKLLGGNNFTKKSSLVFSIFTLFARKIEKNKVMKGPLKERCSHGFTCHKNRIHIR